MRNYLLISFLLIKTVAFAQYQSTEKLYDAQTLIPNINYSEALDRKNVWRHHGLEFDNFLGVRAFSNKAGGNGMYQCTELVHRFLKNIYGIPTKIGNGMGNANKLIQNEFSVFGKNTYMYRDEKPVKMKLLKAGLAKEPPAPSSAINFDIGKAGHVAIVRYVEYVNDNTVYIYLFEQHGYPVLLAGQSSPIHKVKLIKSKEGFWYGEKTPGIGKPLYWINFKLI